MKIYLITLVQIISFFTFSTIAYSKSVSEVETSNKKLVYIEFFYGQFETITEAKTLKKEKISKEDTFITNTGGNVRIIPKVEIPFGKKFGIFWKVLKGDPKAIIPFKIEYSSSGRKHTFPLNFATKHKTGQFFAQQDKTDEPGEKTIAIFLGEKLMFSKTFNVYK
jgi:hypothetical protein